MNKIILENNEEVLYIDGKIKFEKNHLNDLTTYKISILKNTKLLIQYKNFNNKINITFEILDNVKFKLYEIKTGDFTKIQEKYILNDNSEIKVEKFNDVESIKENIIIDLSGINSKIDYYFKTISKYKETYDLIVNHNNINTKSNINNNGINIKNGLLTFNISGIVKKGMKNSVCEQYNRIINETNNKCIIYPNLFIDENNVIANHSAHIGTFDENIIFYLQTRGINIKDAKKLLIKGFLLDNIETCLKKQINKIIKNYWRWFYE